MANALLRRVLVVFAAMSPLGIFAGWALDALTTGMLQEVVSAGEECTRKISLAPFPVSFTWHAGLTALASGTFVYVALVDVLMEEFSTSSDKGTKFACVCGGFAAMAAILNFTHVSIEPHA